MSDIDTTTQEDVPTIEQLRAAADENARLKQQLAQKDTEQFMQIEAGIPMTPAGKAFAAQYNGELTPEKVKEAAISWGLYDPQSENRKEAEQPSDVDNARDILQGRGQVDDGTPPPKRHPGEVARETYDTMVKSGMRESEARKAGLMEILGAAIEGDPRVLIQKNLTNNQRTADTVGIPFQSGRKGVTG